MKLTGNNNNTSTNQANDPPPAYETVNPISNNDFDYSTKIASCSPRVRQNFQSKVYSILSTQLITTLILAYSAYTIESIKNFFLNNMGLFVISSITSIVTCFWIALSPSTDEYFANLEDQGITTENYNNKPWYVLSSKGQKILLAIFTLAEAYCVTTCTFFYDEKTVISAVFITTIVVLAVTVASLSDRFQMCFETMNSIYYWLWYALWLMIGIGLSSFIFGWSSKMDLFYGWLGAIVFTVYLFVDTQFVFRKVSVGDEIKCALMLYLDIINLFLSILRILGNSSDD